MKKYYRMPIATGFVVVPLLHVGDFAECQFQKLFFRCVTEKIFVDFGGKILEK